jgi:hypothetical protein
MNLTSFSHCQPEDSTYFYVNLSSRSVSKLPVAQIYMCLALTELCGGLLTIAVAGFSVIIIGHGFAENISLTFAEQTCSR